MQKLLSVSLVALLFIINAQAAEGKNACKTIKSACESAGFVKGGHKKDNKGLIVDCFKPILEGKTVAGVSASSEDIAACKEQKAKHMEKKEAKK